MGFIGKQNYDGLITGLNPATIIGAGKIKKGSAEAEFKRGTLLGKDADGKLGLYGVAGEEGTFNGTGDGSTVVFSLIDGVTIPAKVTEVKVDGTEVDAGDYVYIKETGDLVFKTAPANTKAIAVKYEESALTPFCVLADDVTVGTDEDEDAPVYTAGCFDPAKLVVAEDYELTDADVDVLRTLNIYLAKATN